MSLPLQLSVIVPFRRNLRQLQHCLSALEIAGADLSPSAALTDLIVVADDTPEDLSKIEWPDRTKVLHIKGPRGPAAARNHGAAVATGNVLVFVDSDVVVDARALARFSALFDANPDLGAAFGAYDERPADRGFISQCKNLSHAFVHRAGSRDAQTFWAGLGAVRAGLFSSLGGFDERFVRPSIEDIELGYRIRARGCRIVLDPEIQGTHLKRWTLTSAIVSDLRDRGIVWTQLIHRSRAMPDDLNTAVKYRLCVVLAYVLMACLVGSLVRGVLLAAVPILLAALWWLEGPYYGYFARRRGWLVAVAWFPVHLVHHVCNGISFVAGTALYAVRSWTGVAIPGSLPLTVWDGHPLSSADAFHDAARRPLRDLP